MKELISIAITLCFLFAPSILSAQGDHYDNGGKLIAVILCVSVILVGVAFFLFYLERRVKRLEDEVDNPL